MSNQQRDFRIPARSGWILIGVACALSLVPLFGFAAWFLAGPILLAAFVLSIVVLSRGGTGAGVLLLLSSMFFAPVFIFFAPMITIALGIGATSAAVIASARDSQFSSNESSILSNQQDKPTNSHPQDTPASIPDPETVILTTDNWSKEIQTDGRTTAFSHTAGADIIVRIVNEGVVTERPISSMRNVDANTLQFKLAKPFSKSVDLTVHQFRNVEEKQKWLSLPISVPDPETVILTTDNWSKEIQTDGRPTAFSHTVGADIIVRIVNEGVVTERPISSMKNVDAKTLQFKLAKPFTKSVEITVHQFRNVEEKQKWLSEP